MKKFLCSMYLALSLSGTLQAIPVWPEPFQVQQADGTILTLNPRGDEWFSYFETTDGFRVIKDEAGNYVYALWGADGKSALPTRIIAHDPLSREVEEREFLKNYPKDEQEKIHTRAFEIQNQSNAQQRIGEMTTHTGAPSIPVILVQFADTKLTETDPKTGYEERLCRPATQEEVEVGKGSAYQYFVDQSLGKFTPNFVVIGPVTLESGYAVYGTDVNGQDANVGQMIVEAIQKDVSTEEISVVYVFDNDKDGLVDAVYVIYAGEGQHALPMQTDLIWPHTFQIENRGLELPEADGVKFNQYSCSSEMMRGKVEGFGTFCHEFSHCLGLPDFYRTDGQSSSVFTMESWSLMDYGSYTDDSFRPIGYRALEKAYMGWITPIELTEATTVKDWKSTDRGGTGLKIVNNVESSEYYIVETIDESGWNKGAFGHGLLISYVFLRSMEPWYNNTVNNTNPPRVSIVGADNDLTTLITGVNEDKYYSSLAGDTYPSPNGNDEFTDSSTPAATVQVGFLGLQKPLTHISYDRAKGTVSFDFMGGSEDNILTGVVAAKNTATVSEGYYRLDGVWLGTEKPEFPGIYLQRDVHGEMRKIIVER